MRARAGGARGRCGARGAALAGAALAGAARAWARGAGLGLASHASYSARGTATTVNGIRLWNTPQNSAHWPPYRPGSSTVNANTFSRPGTASFLNRNSGTKNAWTTSSPVSVTRTGPHRHVHLGTRQADPVDADARPGYSNRQPQRKAVTRISAPGVARTAASKPLRTDGQGEEHDDRRDRDARPQDLEAPVAVDLPRQLVVTGPGSGSAGWRTASAPAR